MEEVVEQCGGVPHLVSSFVDAFVDFSVSGIFFPVVDHRCDLSDLRIATIHPSPERLVAIGDLHGDLRKAKQAFALAGLVNGEERWTGGSSVAVQVGDVLDRGGEEIRLLYLLQRLKIEASRAGGALHVINGNHEVMNVALDFRFVTPEGLREFERWGFWYRSGVAMKRLCDGVNLPKDPFLGIPDSFPDVKEEFVEGIRARIAALRPDGPISGRFLVQNQTVLVIGDSVFVHGGLLRNHVEYGIERLNEEVRDWIKGDKRWMPNYLRGRDSLVWLRRFSDGPDCDCTHLEDVLSTIPGAKRMVMGHTIQERINGVCSNRAIRVDVGLSKGCTNGLPEVLEILEGKQLRVLTSNELFRQKSAMYEAAERMKEGVRFPETLMKEVEVKV
ncbi:calcineurin-like metallo-phosphoesterase superfamily protein [Wolffia australiana]